MGTASCLTRASFRCRPRRGSIRTGDDAALKISLTSVQTVMACALLALTAAAPALAQPPSYDEVKAHAMASDVQVLDRSGELIERVRADFQVRRGDWLALQDISAAFQRAVILSEDQRFYTHAGVDWRGMAAAAWDTLVHERRRGASTLSMQLMGLVDDRDRKGK